MGQPIRPTFRLVPDFILPHLNKSTYGDHLHWEDRRRGSFKISRIHQSSEMWNEHCIEVYKAWSIRKKLWKLDDPKRITKAKHRLITALRRNPDIEMLEKESSFYRFRIIHQNILDEGKANYEAISKRENVPITENVPDNETVKTEDTEVNGAYDYADILDSKENIDSALFTNWETLANSTYYSSASSEPTNSTSYSSALSELYENATKMFPMSSVLNDIYPAETKSPDYSDRCCCDVLLDNYLCNQKCIWHGLPL